MSLPGSRRLPRLDQCSWPVCSWPVAGLALTLLFAWHAPQPLAAAAAQSPAAQKPPAQPAQKPLTLDALYSPEKPVDFSGARTTITWLDDSSFVPQVSARFGRATGGSGSDTSSDASPQKVDALTGNAEPLFDANKLAAALAKVPGLTPEDTRRYARARLSSFSPDRHGLLVTIGDDLYFYGIPDDRLVRITHGTGHQEHPAFSPDGRLVAFVRGNNLFVSDVATGEERALTTDGNDRLLNGKLDWVYQEEIYGRGTFQAFWWSPDSTRLAFLQIDESPVHDFTVVDHLPYRQNLEETPYPKAGDPNPKVKLGIARATGGLLTWANTDTYTGGDFLIVNVAWRPDSRAVLYQVQDREQTWLDLNAAAVTTGEPSRLLRETSKTWVAENGNPVWLKDGSFLWASERSGFEHLYHYSADGALIRQITDGKWEVRTVHGVDDANGWVYFSGTERSPIGSDVYRVKLDGTGLTRLSQTAGTHAAHFSRSFSYYIDDWSDVSTPPQLRLHKADGTEVRVLDEGKVPALADYRLSKPEFLQVKARDGFVMEAMVIKPPDFDPARKYPVFQNTYAGPHAQTVRNAWGVTGNLYLQLLAQKGIVVWECDNRTASGKGIESTWPVFHNFGESELRDIEDCMAWLKKQPYVDSARIGLSGWSFGGFMTSYALTHSKTFAMGIAGGTVSDWRDYDSIYTERYMGMPQNNPDGYKKSSPRFAAKDLSGKLLLLHGLIDDNVHVQNTVQLAYELQKAAKPFELMFYARSRHGVADPQLVYHMRSLMLDFTMRTLQPAGATAGAPTTTASR